MRNAGRSQDMGNRNNVENVYVVHGLDIIEGIGPWGGPPHGPTAMYRAGRGYHCTTELAQVRPPPKTMSRT